MKHRILKVTAIALVLGTTGALSAVGVSRGELDLPFIQGEVSNLQARATNNESDIKQLQVATSTAPASHVDVPVVPSAPVTTTVVAAPEPSTQPAAATPAPTPFVPYVAMGNTGTFGQGMQTFSCIYHTSPTDSYTQSFTIPQGQPQVCPAP